MQAEKRPGPSHLITVAEGLLHSGLRCIHCIKVHTPPSVHHVRSSKDENDKRSLLPVLEVISVSEWNVQYYYANYLLDSGENAGRCNSLCRECRSHHHRG